MDGRVQDVGPSWEKVTGFSAPDAIGTPLQQLLLHSSRSAAQGLLDHAFGGGAASACSLVFAGTPPRAVGTVAAQLLFSNGVPDRVFLTGWSEGQAARPSLTCARPAFEEVLHARLRDAVQAGALLPVALLAVDGLARVNESLGFASGEQALGIVVTRLSACLSSPPCITRIGGDEIAVVLPPCSSPAEAGQMARALLDVLDQPLGLDGRDVTVSATLGLVLAPVHASDPDLLLRFAETAVRCVKNRGRSQVALFDPRWLAARHEARRLETDLVRALQQNELRLQFQPQVRFDGTLAGLEALMEWHHPELGLLPPARFISIAEESGRIGELGEWVLRTAAELAAGWRRRGIFPHRMAVNVSPVQFCQTGFSSLVRAVLIDADLPGSSLELEITESALLDDLSEAHRRMDAIRALGVSLCSDDFGVGYSSLHHLQSLPLDAVKIDRSFVARIAPGSGSLDLIHTITGLARNRGLRIVAEGVETEEQAALSRRCPLRSGPRLLVRPSSTGVSGGDLAHFRLPLALHRLTVTRPELFPPQQKPFKTARKT